MSSSLQESVEALQKALDAAHNQAFDHGPAIKIEHLSTLAAKHLTPRARYIVDEKEPVRSLAVAYDQTEQMPDGPVSHRKVGQAVFYCVQVRKDRLEDGVKAIAESINKLADQEAIVSFLAPMSSVDLALIPGQAPTCAVFCFPHVAPEHHEFALNLPHRIMEGGVGEPLHDLTVDLGEGEFFAQVYISHHMLLQSKEARSPEAMLHEAIEEHLRVLPAGTTFLGHRQCAIVSLAIPYELKFHNPLFRHVRQVELQHIRDVALLQEDGKDRLHQFNLLTGVRYFKLNHSNGQYEWFPKAE